MKFKHEKDKKLFLDLHPMLLRIMFHMNYWCFARKLPFVVTSTLSTKQEDIALKRTSTSHKTGRAFDIAIRELSWTTDDLDNFKIDFEKLYGKFGAVSKRDLVRRLVVIKNNHIHVQIGWEFVNFKTFEYLRG